ncbi:S-4TM family putative pore-forming effector [Streptomyces sp. NPDC006333]|uniref:S-4TM family putative pore-forming effector n=1 Tax=Streptomyces sp. NPDC006333 TaxID=3156753 RepID=UPI0033B47F95
MTRIYETQNSIACIKLLGAQRRLYSDAKNIYNLRISLVFASGILSILAASIFPDARLYIGAASAFIGFGVSLLGSSREKRKAREASSAQELFDVTVFGLPWNDVLAERPSSSLINEAALRYTQNDLQDWYTDTRSVPRPLDVLICQRSNLGWSISAHRAWAATIAGFTLFLICCTTALSLLLDATLAGALVGFYLPILPSVKEAVDIWRANMDSLQTKQKAEGKALVIWGRAIEHGERPSDNDCRRLQDCILMSRQSNAPIPDWFYTGRKKRSQKTMDMSVEDFVQEVTEAGLT